MLALWFIGYAVEQSHGFFAAALLFILPAVGGTLLSAIFLPEYISVGASGGKNDDALTISISTSRSNHRSLIKHPILIHYNRYLWLDRRMSSRYYK